MYKLVNFNTTRVFFLGETVYLGEVVGTIVIDDSPVARKNKGVAPKNSGVAVSVDEDWDSTKKCFHQKYVMRTCIYIYIYSKGIQVLISSHLRTAKNHFNCHVSKFNTKIKKGVLMYYLWPPVQVDTLPMEVEVSEDEKVNDTVSQDPPPAKDIGLKKTAGFIT